MLLISLFRAYQLRASLRKDGQALVYWAGAWKADQPFEGWQYSSKSSTMYSHLTAGPLLGLGLDVKNAQDFICSYGAVICGALRARLEWM